MDSRQEGTVSEQEASRREGEPSISFTVGGVIHGRGVKGAADPHDGRMLSHPNSARGHVPDLTDR